MTIIVSLLIRIHPSLYTVIFLSTEFNFSTCTSLLKLIQSADSSVN